jgi:hypothetical protein
MTKVYLLWHQKGPEDDDAKLLGVYSTKAAAESRIDNAVKLAGFRRYPDGFTISLYEVDQDHWTSGFAQVDHDRWVSDGAWVADPDPEPD